MLNLHLDHLRYLREVARAPTLRAAAKELYRSQPALSQALAEMERRLDVRLFFREGRRLRLTHQGQECLDFAQRMLAEAERFEERLHSVRSGAVGRLRVGMVDAALLYALPLTLRAFTERYPGVDLHLQVSNSRELLRRLFCFELDLAVLVWTPSLAERQLTVLPVMRESLDVVKPRGDRGSPAQARWASYPVQSHTWRLVAEELRRINVTPNLVMESEHPQVLAQVVAMGYCWSVLPTAVWRSQSHRIQRHGKKPLVFRELVAACLPDSLEVPTVRAMFEQMKATAPSNRAPGVQGR